MAHPFPLTKKQSLTNVSVSKTFIDPDVMALDFLDREDLCLMRLIRRRAEDDFVEGLPLHFIVYYNSINSESTCQIY